MRENYVKVSFVVFSADSQLEVRIGHTFLGFFEYHLYILFSYTNVQNVWHDWQLYMK